MLNVAQTKQGCGGDPALVAAKGSTAGGTECPLLAEAGGLLDFQVVLPGLLTLGHSSGSQLHTLY